MAKILVLAKSGFGKSTSLGAIPELGIKGLDPSTTFLISAVNKPLPFRGANKSFVLTDADHIANGNRIVSNDAKTVAAIISMLSSPECPFTNIVLDDMKDRKSTRLNSSHQ